MADDVEAMFEGTVSCRNCGATHALAPGDPPVTCECGAVVAAPGGAPATEFTAELSPPDAAPDPAAEPAPPPALPPEPAPSPEPVRPAAPPAAGPAAPPGTPTPGTGKPAPAAPPGSGRPGSGRRPGMRKPTSKVRRITVVERTKRAVQEGIARCGNCRAEYDLSAFEDVSSCRSCGAKNMEIIRREVVVPAAVEEEVEDEETEGAEGEPADGEEAAAAGRQTPAGLTRSHTTRTWDDLLKAKGGTAAPADAPAAIPRAVVPNATAKVDPVLGKEIGDVLLTEVLGRGAMGTVYRGKPRDREGVVAVKILPPALAHDEEKVKRFVQEATAARKLDHPNIVKYYDVGVQGDIYYIVMEYIEGRSVGDLIKEQRAVKIEESLRIIQEVARGLEAAHARGVIHRDIKPDNILIMPSGAIKVADFGLARDLDANASFSQSGEIVGTPYYISPEQIDCLDVDGRADLYSLGATIYHLITGKRPFEGNTPMEVLLKHVNERLIPPIERNPLIPHDLSRLIQKMMSRDREWRYASAEALLTDIAAIQAGESPEIELEPVEAPEADVGAAVRLPRRRPYSLLAWMLAIAVAGVVAGLYTIPPAEPDGFDQAPPDPVESAAEGRIAHALATAARGPEAVPEAVAALVRLAAELPKTAAAKTARETAARLGEETQARLQAAAAAVRQAAPDGAPPPVLGRALATLQDARRGEMPGPGATAAGAAAKILRDRLLAAGFALVAGRRFERPDGSVAEVGPFLCGRDEVSVEAFRRARGAGVQTEPPDLLAQAAAGERRPVTSVTVAEAEACAVALGGRLPTADEWLAAALCGGARAADAVPPGANVRPAGLGRPLATDETTADETPDGVRHLGGNVAEWTATPSTEAAGIGRVVKGGTFASDPVNARPAAALALPPGTRHPGLGLRIVLDLSK